MGARIFARGRPGDRACGGQNLIELALLMPLLALLMLGTIDLARVFIDHTRLTNAVMAGAVYASHSPAQTSTIIDRAYNEAGSRLGTKGTDFTIDSTTGIVCYQGQTTTKVVSTATTSAGDCTGKDANGKSILQPGDTVEITARYKFKPITGQVIKLLGSSYTIRASVRMVIV